VGDPSTVCEIGGLMCRASIAVLVFFCVVLLKSKTN